MFGSGEEDDEDILLHLFCEHLAEGKTGQFHLLCKVNTLYKQKE